MLTLGWCARYPDDFARAVIVNTGPTHVAPLRARLNVRAVPGLVATRFRSPGSAERAVLAISSNRTDSGIDELVPLFAQWRIERPMTLATVAGQALAGVTFHVPARLDVPTHD